MTARRFWHQSRVLLERVDSHNGIKKPFDGSQCVAKSSVFLNVYTHSNTHVFIKSLRPKYRRQPYPHTVAPYGAARGDSPLRAIKIAVLG